MLLSGFELYPRWVLLVNMDTFYGPKIIHVNEVSLYFKNASLPINNANIESQTFGLTALLLPSLHSYRL